MSFQGYASASSNQKLLFREDNPMTRFFLSLATALCLAVSSSARQTNDKLVYPIIPNIGGVVPLPDAAEQPRKGAKVVFDFTAEAKPTDMNKGLERVARLLNLYGSAGLKASDVKIALVMHGEVTKSVMTKKAVRASERGVSGRAARTGRLGEAIGR
jgi:hypothetical protein